MTPSFREIMGTLLDLPQPSLGNLTLRFILGSPGGRTYIGTTFRTLRDEAYAFLGLRGQEWQKKDGTWTDTGARNLPAITWSDGSCITPSQANAQLDFQALFVYQSTIKANVTRMETLLRAPAYKLVRWGKGVTSLL